jgi:hypothetical protein
MFLCRKVDDRVCPPGLPLNLTDETGTTSAQQPLAANAKSVGVIQSNGLRNVVLQPSNIHWEKECLDSGTLPNFHWAYNR